MKIRIAVAVDNKGRWNAVGHSNYSDELSASIASGDIPDGRVVHWVEADVPLPPAPQTVAGEVVPYPKPARWSAGRSSGMDGRFV